MMLRSWMAPHADIDLRVDGLMRAHYKPDGTLGDGSTIVNKVLSFEPQRMLSIRVAKAPDDFPFPGAIMAMWSVVYFEDAGNSTTRLRAAATPVSATASVIAPASARRSMIARWVAIRLTFTPWFARLPTRSDRHPN